jgi:putative cardiolipin synthase
MSLLLALLASNKQPHMGLFTPRFASFARTTLRALSLLLLTTLLGACASVDFDYPKASTHAFTDTDDTLWGGVIAPQVREHPGEAGFYLQSDGIEALAARGLLAKYAERTLDAQYYLITDDDIGLLFIGSLLGAADRGVRVRLLLDDIQTQGYDAGMAGLDSHPNFEVRIFNPFAGRSTRIGDGLTDLGRVNRRMHNKSFTVDNQVTIIGGRNIAAEYFNASENVNFGDADVLAVGPLVGEVSAMFDLYWNNIAAAPVPAFAKMPNDPAAELQRLRQRIQRALDRVQGTRYGDALREDITRFSESDSELFTWAPYTLAFDAPEKADKAKAGGAQSIVTTMAESVALAQRELIVISPYFVPRKSGLEFFRELRDRGIEVTVITNSLAATNHSVVHSGYAPARKPLLKMGVRIFEVRHHSTPSGVERGGKGATLATLHTKAFMVDREDLFIGSFNWDPRSVNLNTELGVIIHSPEMGRAAGERIDNYIVTTAYEVVLNDKGKLRWIDRAGEREVVLKKEPDTSAWRRFSAAFMGILPIRGQL